MLPVVNPGDIFVSRNPMFLGRAINTVQKFHSKDKESTYSHSGIIIDERGTTFEALWTNRKQNLFEAYKGKRVLIGRHKDMCPAIAAVGWACVKKYEGKAYAGWRLPLFFIPFAAKFVNTGNGVCSELTMKYLKHCRLAPAYQGWNPDDIADMIRRWKEYEIIYEGILE